MQSYFSEKIPESSRRDRESREDLGMKKLLLLVLALMMVLSSVCALAEPVELTFATMAEGTGPYKYAVALKEIIEKALPEGSVVTLVPDSKGAVEAPAQIDAGECDLIMSNAGPAAWYAAANEDTKVRALFGGLGYDFMNVMMTKAYADANGVTTLEEIVAKQLPVRLAVKEEGSLGAEAAVKTLIALGITFEDIENWGGKVIRTNSAGIREAIEKGEADLTIDHISAWQANTTALCENVEMHFVQLESTTLEKLTEYGFAAIDIEPNMFKWQSAGIGTVGSQQVVLVSSDMDVELARAITVAVCENADKLAAADPGLERFVAMDAGQAGLCGAQVHAGAAQYYWEMGYSAK